MNVVFCSPGTRNRHGRFATLSRDVFGEGIFKGAATTVIGQAKDEPLHRHYLRLLDGGTKPNLAKLTLARQIASIVLATWRNEEAYDPKKLKPLA